MSGARLGLGNPGPRWPFRRSPFHRSGLPSVASNGGDEASRVDSALRTAGHAQFVLGNPNGELIVCARSGAQRQIVASGLGRPFQTACDAAGTALYVACNDDGRVLKLHLPSGAALLASSSEHRDPFGVAVMEVPAARSVNGATHAGSAERVFVVDRANARVCAFDASQLQPLFAFGRRGRGPGKLDDPWGCAAHRDVFFVADRGNSRIVSFDVCGRPLRAIGAWRWGLAPVDGLAIASSLGECNPQYGVTLTDTPAGSFLGPSGVAVAAGQLFVVDSMGVRGRVLQALAVDAGHAPRQWLRVPGVTRLIGVGATRDAVFVCDAAAPAGPRAGGWQGRPPTRLACTSWPWRLCAGLIDSDRQMTLQNS